MVVVGGESEFFWDRTKYLLNVYIKSKCDSFLTSSNIQLYLLSNYSANTMSKTPNTIFFNPSTQQISRDDQFCHYEGNIVCALKYLSHLWSFPIPMSDTGVDSYCVMGIVFTPTSIFLKKS